MTILYLVFTYRYFLHQFPDLCIFAVPIIDGKDDEVEPVGCVVCKVDPEEEVDGHQYQAFCHGIENTDGDKDTATVEGDAASLPSRFCGYIAMLAVDTAYRRSGIGTALVKRSVRRMIRKGCASVMLETEVSNKAAMKLYQEKLGFIREELLVRYYLNWGDAYRLRLWLK